MDLFSMSSFSSMELRKVFLDFFHKRDHRTVSSSPLVPERDPSLLFTSAGMVQFKPYYSGGVPLSYSRATSIQKCLRVTDLDEVGKTPRHCTFFEMMGNFSFGDYFKKEAVEWAWEFLLEIVKLPEEKLSVSVYEEDDEAYNLWKDHIGLESHRLFRLGEEHNFWGPAGKTGACGPSSEIFYDLGREKSCGKSTCKPGCDCDRYFEIWNLVFPQFDQQEDGSRAPLKNRGIDTGMGMERLALACQGVDTIFKTDLFKPIIEECCNIFRVEYHDWEVSLNIIADHIRALTFALSEGVYPSNEGRGYVLRQILRRAVRQGQRIKRINQIENDNSDTFLHQLVKVVCEVMKESYPELLERQDQVTQMIQSEEESFLRTLDRGLEILEGILSQESLRAEGEAISSLTGKEAFKLYDTYGLPLEIIEEKSKEKGYQVDKKGFEKEMEEQKERGKTASKFEQVRTLKISVREDISVGEKIDTGSETQQVRPSLFVGYEKNKVDARIIGWNVEGEDAFLILDQTPFYAEAGGQVGDTGKINGEEFAIEVVDTQKSESGNLHRGKMLDGEIQDGDVTAEIDVKRRLSIMRNHTGTHLLHSALREVLGKHVRQEGSLVAPDHLRFDFAHYHPVTQKEREEIEVLVNEKIRENISIEFFETSFEDARAQGALAFFGEKYGDRVRVVQIGDFSMELCGGTHLSTTGEMGLFKLSMETGSAAGIRRVEALSGEGAYEYIQKQEKVLRRLTEEMKVGTFEVGDRFEKILEEKRNIEARLARMEEKMASMQAIRLVGKTNIIEGIRVLTSKVDLDRVDSLRKMADELREKFQENSVGVLGCEIKGKAFFLAFVTNDLTSKIKAGDIVREVAKIAGGKGGGKPHLAEAGGKDVGKIDTALSKAPEIVKTLIQKK
jgi:alanyl-tRNA synthetase